MGGLQGLVEEFESLTVGSVPGALDPGIDTKLLPRPLSGDEESAKILEMYPLNSHPRILRLTTHAIPNSQSLLSRWHLPLGAVVHPLAEAPDKSALPSLGVGRLRLRGDDLRVYGTDKEHTLRLPEDPFYKQMAAEFTETQIAVDIYAFSEKYSDIASLGVRLTTYHGHCMLRSTDLLALPAVDCDKAFAMQLSLEETLMTSQTVYFQVALLSHVDSYTDNRQYQELRPSIKGCKLVRFCSVICLLVLQVVVSEHDNEISKKLLRILRALREKDPLSYQSCHLVRQGEQPREGLMFLANLLENQTAGCGGYVDWILQIFRQSQSS
ncbi:hypothetical protein B296_00010393 [Ensete ventricosum]|uniref:Sec23/Sec24 trunk domain-containing protein n=1 Tax=Ensete ventricosum TaxID=4639 RepID=A0A427B3E2_ENSVE|nr:hypothetical protein B296_00010393 [Ensete ventricosum]